jgi:protein-tyrosine-phosphatase/predicted ATP-grasp superfamily ATP-dependent carboligase
MSASTGRVLVLGNDTRSFLSVIRSLGRAGLEVHAAWADPDCPALRSRYLRQTHFIARYSASGDRWQRDLIDLLREYSFDAVIPCHDVAVAALHKHRDELGRWTRLSIPNEEAYAICFDKRQTYDLAESLAIPLPRQARVASVEEIEDVAGSFGMPLVLKPSASISLDAPDLRNEVRKVSRRAEIREAAKSLLARGPVVVQENFLGVGVGVEVLCREGEVLTAFQHERVHEPLHGGGSSYRKSVALSAPLLDATRRLMKAMAYTGVAMAEFKVNHATGAWVLIEINGRFWGSLPLTLAAGADFPRYLYDMTVRGREAFPQEYRVGLYGRNWRLDTGWLRRNLSADRKDPTLLTLPLSKVAAELLHLARERSDTFTIRDPWPALVEIAQIFARLPRPSMWMLPGARALMRHSGRVAVLSARRILVACKGNICRSPFAEACLKRYGDFEVRSAGLYPVEGRESPPEAREAARAFGVDLTAHRSRILTAEDAAWADTILIFDREQRRAIAKQFPEAARKVHYLGALGPQANPAIRDPWGRDVAEFAAVYREIERAAAALRVNGPWAQLTRAAVPDPRV